MTLALAAELGPRGITVNAVAPGWIATEGNAAVRQNAETVRRLESQTALGRLGAPEDVADVVSSLASDDSRLVTGQYLEVSDGLKLPWSETPSRRRSTRLPELLITASRWKR
jgi:3-oxoacyl-[acyl-carrier protein] reductase